MKNVPSVLSDHLSCCSRCTLTGFFCTTPDGADYTTCPLCNGADYVNRILNTKSGTVAAKELDDIEILKWDCPNGGKDCVGASYPKNLRSRERSYRIDIRTMQQQQQQPVPDIPNRASFAGILSLPEALRLAEIEWREHDLAAIVSDAATIDRVFAALHREAQSEEEENRRHAACYNEMADYLLMYGALDLAMYLYHAAYMLAKKHDQADLHHSVLQMAKMMSESDQVLSLQLFRYLVTRFGCAEATSYLPDRRKVRDALNTGKEEEEEEEEALNDVVVDDDKKNVEYLNLVHTKMVQTFTKLKLYFGYGEQKYLYANFDKLFPNVTKINSKMYKTNQKINASKTSINQFKIVDMIEEKPAMTDVVNSTDINKNIKKLVERCLPHVSVNGRSVDISKCVVVDLLHSDIQSFPSIHTDIEWGVFNKSDGFQIWYLYENDDDVGNMFLFEKSDVLPSTHLLYDDKSITTVNQCGGETITVNTHKNNKHPKVYYLDMRSGECLIFGKSMYHASDHRKSKYRYSINCRVVLTDNDGGIPINTDEKCLYSRNFMNKLSRKKIPIKNGKIYCGMFDLMNLF